MAELCKRNSVLNVALFLNAYFVSTHADCSARYWHNNIPDSLFVSLDETFNAHCCHKGTAMNHPVPDRVKPSFVIFDIRTL